MVHSIATSFNDRWTITDEGKRQTHKIWLARSSRSYCAYTIEQSTGFGDLFALHTNSN